MLNEHLDEQKSDIANTYIRSMREAATLVHTLELEIKEILNLDNNILPVDYSEALMKVFQAPFYIMAEEYYKNIIDTGFNERINVISHIYSYFDLVFTDEEYEKWKRIEDGLKSDLAIFHRGL